MAHYAYLDQNNIVTQVIVGKDENEDGIDWEQYYDAVRTSYNTHGGVHINGGTPFRYNYAGVGYTFSNDPEWSAQNGAFIPPQPYQSWIINPNTALWEAPKPKPPASEGPWYWDEQNQEWMNR